MITRRPEDPLGDLKALEKKIAQTKARHAKPQGEGGSEDMNLAMRLGLEFVSGVLVGAFLGYWADRLLGTWPLLFIVCFVLGLAAGVLTMYRTLQRSSYEESVDTQAAPSGVAPAPDDDEDA